MVDQKKILIIGAGNLGSRHLQALKTVKFPLNISVIDPNKNSLDIAKERYNSIKSGISFHSINFYENIPPICEKIDLAIIATNSDVRKKVVVELLSKVEVKFIILEKILFQNLEDYDIIDELFRSNGTKAWVNCPRRIFPIYQKGRDLFQGEKPYFKVSGSNFGLMSNIIHFIDIMAYITQTTDFSLDVSNLIPELKSSKRSGFNELNGEIRVNFKSGSYGLIHCLPTGSLPIIHEIYSGTKRLIIKETEGDALFYDNNSEMKWTHLDAKFMYQSQITTKIVEDLFLNNICELTSYNESKKLHISIFKPILNYMNSILDEYFEKIPFS